MESKLWWMQSESDDFWNRFAGAWGTAQMHFRESPQEHEDWLFMQKYVKNLEQKVKNMNDLMPSFLKHESSPGWIN